MKREASAAPGEPEVHIKNTNRLGEYSTFSEAEVWRRHPIRSALDRGEGRSAHRGVRTNHAVSTVVAPASVRFPDGGVSLTSHFSALPQSTQTLQLTLSMEGEHRDACQEF